GVLMKLPGDIASSIILAYRRTSLSIKESNSQATEKKTESTVSPVDLYSAALGMKVGLKKVERNLATIATESSFLAYSETDVEHDFLRIIDLLSREHEIQGASRWQRMLRWLWAPERPVRWSSNIIIVLDELDRLSANKSHKEALYDMMVGLKNVLTVNGVRFMLVGGPELFEEYLRDVQRGHGVLESIFSSSFYVSCAWSMGRELLAGVIDPAESPPEEDLIASLSGYLDYQARGLPRRLLQHFNKMVTWNGGSAALVFSETELAKMQGYTTLQRVIARYSADHAPKHIISSQYLPDRW